MVSFKLVLLARERRFNHLNQRISNQADSISLAESTRFALESLILSGSKPVKVGTEKAFIAIRNITVIHSAVSRLSRTYLFLHNEFEMMKEVDHLLPLTL